MNNPKKIKNSLFTLIGFLCFSIQLYSQNPSAIVDFESTNKGILIPRMTEVEKDAIIMPAIGLMIYQNNEVSGFYYYNGTDWTPVSVLDNQTLSEILLAD